MRARKSKINRQVEEQFVLKELAIPVKSSIQVALSQSLKDVERRRHRQEYGYVAIEILYRQRETHVTTIGPNDVIGDFEIFLDLPTYCATMECLENLQVYELSKYNFFSNYNSKMPKNMQYSAKRSSD